MERVDAHHHVWRLARGDYSFPTPDLRAIYRDFEPGDLRPLLLERDIGQTVLVQATPTPAETEFLLGIAEATDWVGAVVGWVDLADRGAPERLGGLARRPKLKGVRPMLQDIPDVDWILRPDLRPACEALLRLGLRLDALVRPPQLPALRAFVERFPELPLVVDHAGKPEIRAWRERRGGFDAWATHLTALARSPRVFCKLSGLVTEAGPGWSPDDLRPFVEHLVTLFGPDRLMWGSDWPVVELAGGYAAWWDASDRLLAPLGEAERAAVLGGTARRFYGLARSSEPCRA